MTWWSYFVPTLWATFSITQYRLYLFITFLCSIYLFFSAFDFGFRINLPYLWWQVSILYPWHLLIVSTGLDRSHFTHMPVSKWENARINDLRWIGIIWWFSLLLIAYLPIIFLIILNISISNLISFIWIWWPSFKLDLHYLILLFLIHNILILLILHTMIHLRIILDANIEIGVVVRDIFNLICDIILICMNLNIWLGTYLRAIGVVLVCIIISW